MTLPAPKCLRCAGEMRRGYIVDRNQGWYEPVKWFEGELTRGWLGDVKTKDKQPMLVTTYRCGQCGYLESYAQESYEAEA